MKQIITLLFLAVLATSSSCSKDLPQEEQEYLKIAITNNVLSDEPLIVELFKEGSSIKTLELEFDKPYVMDSIPVGENFAPEISLNSDSIIVYYYNRTACITHNLSSVDVFEVNLRNIFKQINWYRKHFLPYDETKFENPDLRDYEYVFTGGQLNILRECN
ncbi:hypothetical protein [Flagellimonas lutimaris]|jgi:hypothetical protein|uniref:hypothetical protein n=1 Tax=Flagellimonas TaxID=444459 RepID=UPI000B65C19D|nr:MAG: hypothetical protein CBB72_006560 [Muricauda sp. TMED12]|tara:strand:+ start:1649 stop:2131 length:483 start_codon:yes stop_codon:yes gene_type:complete